MTYEALMIRKALKCSTCKYFKLSPNRKPMCTLFKFEGLKKEKVFFADTEYCRDRETLCGPYAKYFEEDV